MDLNNLPNPYDFANPVSDETLFVGRKKELEEIKYYLDHAALASRPINIALLGPRASGKTSLLNMCEIEAKKRKFFTVRIDLDEEDAKTQLGFFYKIFDGILSSICELGEFGGIAGGTYNTYLDIINSYVIPDDKTFCPFLFPLSYAKAMSAGNINAPLSDHNYKSDLLKIMSEVKYPVAILFDEGNVLAKSKVHLEKLRNIFMNIPGYMLVITGTPDLFPVMDEVFSPIIRQFKKINVGSFKEEKETEECIRKPLDKLAVNPEEIIDFETYEDIYEIHNLSGGRPYEIQLICHILFRRIQNKRTKKMKLDFGILEEVIKELETSQDINIRPILNKIKNLKKQQLKALSLLCTCEGLATFDQIWAIEFIYNGKKNWTKNSFYKEFQYLINEQIIYIENGKIKFAGDDFDKIYTKYFAREMEVNFNPQEIPVEFFWIVMFTKFTQKIKNLNVFSALSPYEADFDILGLITKIRKINHYEDIFAESSPMIEDLYKLMIAFRNRKNAVLIQVKFNLLDFKGQSWYYIKSRENTKEIKNFQRIIAPLKQRLKKFGGNLSFIIKKYPIVPVNVLAYKVQHSANELLRNNLADYHNKELINEYVDEVNSKEALFHGDLLYKYFMPLITPICNNLGYLYMSVGDYTKARELLEKAVFDKDQPFLALSYYNLGILEAKCNNYVAALEKIQFCIENVKDKRCGCIFLPKVIKNELIFKEVRKQPNLLETALKAKKNLEHFLDKRGKNDIT